MNAVQCATGAIWVACVVDVYSLYGIPGVAGFFGLSLAIGAAIFRKLTKKETPRGT